MIELITGGMFSGKTNLLIKKMEEFEKEGKVVVRIKPIQDNRYSEREIVSHDGKRVRAIPVEEVFDIASIMQEDEGDVLAIDEVQFFNWSFIDVIQEIVSQQKHVLLAGVDLDFAGRPFGIMPELCVYADILHKLNAKCSVCGETASRSQRFVNGRPSKPHEPVFLKGSDITYEPRCRFHHEITLSNE